MEIIQHLRKALEQYKDENTRVGSQRFFKEEINSLGIKAPLIHKISKEFFKQLKSRSKNEIFTLCEELWKSGILEESLIASNWSYYINKHYQAEDFFVFRKWVENYVNNWASCDTLCNHTIGSCMEMYPENISELLKMTQSDNRWVRRASAVSLIVPARRGKFHDEILEIADSLLTDSDDLVQKGYGWMLKVTSQSDPERIFQYVMKNKSLMPRTSLRYAIEKLPADLRKMAMKK